MNGVVPILPLMPLRHGQGNLQILHGIGVCPKAVISAGF